MTTPSLNSQTFYTFHTNTAAVPTEISTQILDYIIADAQPLLLGGSVKAHTRHHPIASVSQTLRSIYLDSPIFTSTKERPATLLRLRIGEALEFGDLKTMAAFFQNGPGRHTKTLCEVRFLSISFLDSHTPMIWWQRTTDYAYEAFESLHKHWGLMQINWLRLCLPYTRTISSIDDPGLWSLLKIRNLPHLTITGPRGCIPSHVRRLLKAQTHKKKLFPWRPLGLENPGGSFWANNIKDQGRMDWEEQYIGLTPGTSIYTTGRLSLQGVKSSDEHITSGEDGGRCYRNGRGSVESLR
ncbi:hypothetical protein BJ875DRAFT_476148 [Amylocarpus encephaloides]|uniref:Uncharacterized protein n=1 Tax=Amylocarpus encephaloides TaxID=45428 RepID=A0A9P8C0L2_9HELO|nr:hypothetical protein BJ875DRAFT_476148 [Amylocarpus encephaloides]